MRAEKGEDGTWIFQGQEETFAYQLARGTWSLKAVIDSRLEALSENWDIKRMGKVDLAIFTPRHLPTPLLP